MSIAESEVVIKKRISENKTKIKSVMLKKIYHKRIM